MPQKMTLHFWKIVFEFHNLQRNGGGGGEYFTSITKQKQSLGGVQQKKFKL